MVNFFRNITVLGLMLILSACGTVKNWLADDVYEAPPEELVEFQAEFEPDELWSIDTGSGADDYSDLSAWLQSDAVFTIDKEGDVSSFDSNTGKKIWRNDLDVPIVSGVGGGDGLIIVGTKDGFVIALDETTGEVKWKKALSSEVLSPSKASDGVVVVRTADGRLTGLTAIDGTVLWTYQRSVPLLSLRGASEAIIAEGKVIAGYANGKLVALALHDGALMWEKNVAVPRGRTELDRLVDIDSAPVVKNGEIYVVAYNGRLASLSIDSGDVLWYREMSSRVGLDVEYGDAVYVTDDQSYVWAVQDGTGDALWRQTRLLRRSATAPVIVGSHVIVGDLEGYVHWISREDGRFVARTKISDSAIRSKPIVKDDLVYITASDGTLTAFRIQ